MKLSKQETVFMFIDYLPLERDKYKDDPGCEFHLGDLPEEVVEEILKRVAFEALHEIRSIAHEEHCNRIN